MTTDFNQQQDERPPETLFSQGPRTWKKKFQDALSGVVFSVDQQSSYKAHLVFAVLVPVTAFGLQLDLLRWCLLLLCIFAVLAAEMFNTAIETLAKAITRDHNEQIGRALDIASGAVLLSAIGASLVGSVIFIDAVLKYFH